LYYVLEVLVYPIGFRPSATEYKNIERACAELSCSRSDLLRMAARETIEALHQQGFTSAKSAALA
jgi:hypothetical protein